MAELLINSWGGGIGDDPFLARDGECLDMDGIDIRTTPRRITADVTSAGIYATDTLSASGETLNHLTETIDGLVQSYNTNCYINSTGINPLVAGADRHITVGSNLNNYDVATNPEGIRHIFFTYNNSTNPIKLVGYTGGVRSVLNTVNTSGGASPANILNDRTSAVCYYTESSILFSRANKIYEFNPITNLVFTGATTPVQNQGARILLKSGAIVKNIYVINGQIVVIYTVGNDTEISTYSRVGDSSAPNGYFFLQSSYIDIIKGEKCLSSVYDKSFIYWLSTSGIFQYSGTSQLVKKYPLTTSAVCAYGKGILRIGDGTNFYEYGINKPGYGNPLTRKSVVGVSIKGVSESYILTYRESGTQYKIDTFGGAYKQVNTYTTHPYSAGQFGWKKKGLGLLLGVALPRIASYTDSAIQCSISIGIQTDLMERVDSSVYAPVYTETDAEARVIHITPKMITDALTGYSDEWGYIRFKITLNAGDPFSGYGNTLFRKTPEVYDVYFTHTEVDNPFK